MKVLTSFGFNADPDEDPASYVNAIWNQAFDDQKFYNFIAEKTHKSHFFVKDVQTTGEVFSPPKRTSSTSKQEIS